MEKEDRIVEPSNVVICVVEVLVDLTKLAFVVIILESGGSRAKNVKEKKGQHSQSQEHNQRE